jgi:hypothetical protein
VTGGLLGVVMTPAESVLNCSGTWYHPGQPGYRYFDLVVAGYAGPGNVTAEIDTFSGVSAGSAHGGTGMW